ncbi:long-chain fatty acid--CoA ligase [Pollutimonas subterranea]|uniref:Long-chain-fatty-acid--CoA ligase n=1 Tax=Pollutimonas subterranea TaxID=2045210 RepID=A0A2N4U171_9BURK|nr:AMP-binding protein [Pollutimonas subterranea]PLC48761.1 long-chain fatty acid--CoA ligase [Pollutimonas subterranea]
MDTARKRQLTKAPIAEINVNAYTSLVDMLDKACRKHGSRRALTLMGCGISYRELDRRADAIAAWLQQQGLPQGSRVALMMPNVMPYMVALLGALRAGMVVVNINPLYTGRELEYQLRDSGAQAIFILENFAAALDAVPTDVRPPCVVKVMAGDMLGWKGRAINFTLRHIKKAIPSGTLPEAVRFSTALRQGGRLRLDRPELTLDDIALLQYTGGTTGVPKGAMLTHRNLVANVLQVDAVAQPALGELASQPLTILSALPLYHIFALTICGLFAVHAGMCGVLIANPRDLSSILRAWRRDPVHVFPGVNTLFNSLVNSKGYAALDFSGLRLCLGGGSAVLRPVADKWQALTGVPLIEGYGLSETSPVVSANPTDATEYSGDIGFPVPSTEVMLLDRQDREVPRGEPGELAVRGPQVTPGYWQRPDETKEAFSSLGFFKTGDIATMSPEGRLRIIDRKKDMILVSGFNVYPAEVEEVVSGHPGVLECAAIGVPDGHAGEVVKLFVVRKDPDLDDQALKAWCRDRLTGYKRPRLFEYRSELPKSNVGKILRRSLRDEALAGQAPAA